MKGKNNRSPEKGLEKEVASKKPSEKATKKKIERKGKNYKKSSK